MHLVSFNIFRTLGLPNTQILKPEQFLQHKELLQQADWVLFPEYWQLNALVHGLKCRVFPSISSYRIGHDKIEMTRAFQTVAALHTPWTLILANGPEEREQVWQTMSLPFVAKHPKASMGEGPGRKTGSGNHVALPGCSARTQGSGRASQPGTIVAHSGLRFHAVKASFLKRESTLTCC